MDSQYDMKITELETMQYGNTFEYGDQEIVIQNRKQATALQKRIAAEQRFKQSEAASYQQIGQVLADLFPEEHTDAILFNAGGFQAVCRVYPAFARDERIDEIYDAHWRCLGKVVGIISASKEYSFLKDAPISYIARDQFEEFTRALSTEGLNIETTDPIIAGPALMIATLAIFV